MAINGISKATVQRLPGYLTYLKTLPASAGCHISATTIAAALNMGEVQVRKDLAAVSGAGKPKIGYRAYALINDLEAFLGYHDIDDAVVIGAGKLGQALLQYEEFAEYGLNIIAGFDLTEAFTENFLAGKPVLPLSKFPDLCKLHVVRIGIITVPADAAQHVCDLMVDNGILAICNFAPVHLTVPEGILVQNENIAATLAALASQLKTHPQNDNA
ncbi:MAG: redox-sensing transcriptional repressor Rex [Oscillospiraceae bacterium]